MHDGQYLKLKYDRKWHFWEKLGRYLQIPSCYLTIICIGKVKDVIYLTNFASLKRVFKHMKTFDINCEKKCSIAKISRLLIKMLWSAELRLLVRCKISSGTARWTFTRFERGLPTLRPKWCKIFILSACFGTGQNVIKNERFGNRWISFQKFFHIIQ